MNVLMIGGGGREHSWGWKIAQDPRVTKVLYAPGNAGTELEDKSENVVLNGDPFDATKLENLPELERLIESQNIELVLVGPEAPLDWGIVDKLSSKTNVFGPTSAAAELESDKFVSHDVMEAAGVPQAEGIKCASLKIAQDAIRELSNERGVVLKARGLTGGKGVTVCDSQEEALNLLNTHAQNFGYDILVSKRLVGPEVSVFGISDGQKVLPFEMASQDHKPLLTGDFGPNTGGMGAYCPVEHFAGLSFIKEITDTIMTPTIREMAKRGAEYRGILYVGLMLTSDGPKVLEFNIRLGDPECQPLMTSIKSGLLDPIMTVAKGGRLEGERLPIEYHPGGTCCVVMAANGYPASYDQGQVIEGVREAERIPGVKVFHAGTTVDQDGKLVTSGGRVLGVTAHSPNGLVTRLEGVPGALENAYKAVEAIDRETTKANRRRVFIYRKDIAHQVPS